MDESILETVKEVIGIDQRNYDFDRDLIIAINAVLFVLYQEGLSDKPYTISDNTTKWSDVLLHDKPIDLQTLTLWMGLRVRMIFDPPTSATMADAIEKTITELEWRGFITNNFVGEIGTIYGN